ncbi:hypothetical protein H2200_002243 [Cladophialophora chaetospira]|uniref:Glutathione S-transferase n=1 Tax=Cladophialophora chaetospira TaxID=386627 RepID=A0AA39CMW7_9EURO|nr:hypothetical protein H2200_002243 [Cladophialophora chaetospira]
MATSSSKDQLFLWDHPVSSYAQKIRIALREKDIPFTAQVPRGLGSGFPNATDESFASSNPRIEVPVLVDGDLQIFDSTIILEYIEDKFPEPALLPPRTDPTARAKARMIEDVCDTQYEGLNWGLGEINWFKRAEGEAAEKLKAQAKHQTKQLQAWLNERLGGEDYFGGVHGFGWADVCVAPILNRSLTYGLGPEQGSPLAKWLERISQRPSVQKTFEEYETATKNTPGYGDLLKKGMLKREYRDHRLEWMVKSGGIDIVVEGLKNKNIRFSWPDPLE